MNQSKSGGRDTGFDRPLAGGIVPLALLLLAGHALRFSQFIIDDAFISWRYSRNIAAGLGPVFNAGEHVEGFSNPVYTFLLAIPAKFLSTATFPDVARGIGLFAGLLALMMMARWPRLGSGAGATIAILFTAISTSFALWSVAGLETTLYALLLVAGIGATLARPRSAAGQIGTGLLLAAITLSRPEAIVPATLLFLSRFVDSETRSDWSGHLRVLLAFVVPVGGYLAFRVSWFGDWLPNTWYAKKPGAAEAWRRGSWYLVSYVHHNGGKWLFAAAPLALLDRSRRRLVLLTGAILAATAAYILFVGGDWMDQHRFLAPVVPCIALWVGLGWGVVIDELRHWLKRWPGGSLVRLVMPLGVIVVIGVAARASWELTEGERKAGGYVNARPYYETVGRLIGSIADPGWSVATHDIGAVGWYGGIRVVDLLGLVDRDLARGRVTAEGLVSREKPELLLLHYDNRPSPLAGTSRWRPFDFPAFDSLYAVPTTKIDLPASVRVRYDRSRIVHDRLAALDPAIRTELRTLTDWLERHEPDGIARP